MKNKILVFILSIFLALGCFINTVNAEITNMQDLFDEYGSKYLESSSNKFTNGNATLYFIDEGNNTYYATFDSSDSPEYEYLNYLHSINIIETSNNIFEGTVAATEIVTIKLKIVENEISTIEISGYTDNSFTFLNGTYTPQVKIADIIPSDFPTSASTSWLNGDGSTYTGAIYLDGSEVNFYGGQTIFRLDTVVSKDTNGNYYIYNPSLNSTLTFNMNNGTFSSITVTGLTGAYAPFNGTYAKPLRVHDLTLTIYDDSDFIFLNENENKAHISSDTLTIDQDTLATFNPLTKEGNNYFWTNKSSDTKYLFVMTSGKLSAIKVSNSPNTDTNGTYYPYDFQKPITDYPIGYSKEISFRLNAPFSDSTGATIKYSDGVITPFDLTENTDYTLTPGSTVVTLTSDFVKSLTGIRHTIYVQLIGYPERSIEFTFSNSSSNNNSIHSIPNTGVK